MEEKTTTNRFQAHWPIAQAMANGQYFYDIPIEQYISATEVRVAGRGNMLMFGGYSYLSLHRHPQIQLAARRALSRFGSGGHGVRLLAGTTSIHRALEVRIAQIKRVEAAITYSSGYLANTSGISALLGRHDTLIIDQYCHASILDGCRLSGARIRRFKHNEADHLALLLEQDNPGRVMVVVDGVYSMDGDIVDLPRISWLCRKHQALLMVDESHALGVIGERGTGVEEHFGLPPDTIDIKMGTFSKAIPSQGGYIASTAEICEFLKHQSSGFIYSGANNPVSDAASLAALDLMENEPERIARLQRNARYARRQLQAAGLNTLRSETAIIPILCGSDENAYNLAKACHARGLFLQAIPHPVVPKGQARLRININAAHTTAQIDRLVQTLASIYATS